MTAVSGRRARPPGVAALPAAPRDQHHEGDRSRTARPGMPARPPRSSARRRTPLPSEGPRPVRRRRPRRATPASLFVARVSWWRPSTAPGLSRQQAARSGCASVDGLPGASCRAGSRARTPTEDLDLQPGELVRVKSREEILATLDENLLNRGMGFDAEMSRFCGRTAVVQARVDRCLDERTGRMLTMKNPCIILENTVCRARSPRRARASTSRSGGRSGLSGSDPGTDRA